LNNFYDIYKIYNKLYENYNSTGFNKILNPKDKEFNNNIEQYFSIGNDALSICVHALIDNKLSPPKKILDFPSGSGRVLRHLKSYFKDSLITACDLYEDHLNFCVNNFQVNGMLSEVDISKLNVKEPFDLIFVGSLLTHLPLIQYENLLEFLHKSLNQNGIAIVTTEGRFSIYAHYNNFKFIDNDKFKIAEDEYNKNGFGFVDYNHDFIKSNFEKHETYGLTLTHPSFLINKIMNMKGLSVVGHKERAWNRHQDIYILQKRNLYE
jgi:ubiquinone/menaquinone biosynthesis C-methylase UbiE